MTKQKEQRLIKLIRRDDKIVEVEKDYILKDNETYTECDCMIDADRPLEEWHDSFIDNLSASEKEKFYKNPNEYGR